MRAGGCEAPEGPRDWSQALPIAQVMQNRTLRDLRHMRRRTPEWLSVTLLRHLGSDGRGALALGDADGRKALDRSPQIFRIEMRVDRGGQLGIAMTEELLGLNEPDIVPREAARERVSQRVDVDLLAPLVDAWDPGSLEDILQAAQRVPPVVEPRPSPGRQEDEIPCCGEATSNLVVDESELA